MEFLIGWGGKLLLLAFSFAVLATATEALFARFTSAGGPVTRELPRADQTRRRPMLGRRRSA